MVFREVSNPSIRDFSPGIVFATRSESMLRAQSWIDSIQLTGSGKAALAAVLSYLTAKKKITSKLDEMLVPDWIGYWVYNQIQPFAFPTKKWSTRTKAILVYHQYGFPQKMDKIIDFARSKKLTVIEDCAHVLDSSYKEKKLGSWGDFAIYSYSKWFFCFALGGVKTKHQDFSIHLKRLESAQAFGLSTFKDLIKLFYELSLSPGWKFINKLASNLLNMSYSIYGDTVKPGNFAAQLLKNKIDHEIHIRKKRYRLFKEKVEQWGICNHLGDDDVTPYVIPIITRDEKLAKVINAFQKIGINSGIYHFDINRSLLSPDFVKCAWMPCHSSIPDEKFFEMLEIIRRIG
jgi:hypothetical protein